MREEATWVDLIRHRPSTCIPMAADVEGWASPMAHGWQEAGAGAGARPAQGDGVKPLDGTGLASRGARDRARLAFGAGPPDSAWPMSYGRGSATDTGGRASWPSRTLERGRRKALDLPRWRAGTQLSCGACEDEREGDGGEGEDKVG